MIFTGAGGGKVCAASLSVDKNKDLVIDQTLYWRVVPSEDEAFYFVGILNSDAVTQAIQPFVPQGEFGERHLHTLPHRVIPRFDARNREHQQIVQLARELNQIVNEWLSDDAHLADPARSISARRRKVRTKMQALEKFSELEKTSAFILQR